MNTTLRTDQPLMRMLSLKQEFPTAWHKFLHPTIDGDEQVLRFTIGKERFPFFAQIRQIKVTKIEIFATCAEDEAYPLILAYNDGTVISPTAPSNSLITLRQNHSYGGLNTAIINMNDDAGLDLQDLDITREISLKIKRNSAPDFTALSTQPDEVENVCFVFHYNLG